MVSTKPILDDISNSIKKQSVFTSNPDLIPNPAANKVLAEWYNKLGKLPDKVPFDQLRRFRQALDKAIEVHNGWSETANAADRAEMAAQRSVVNSIRGGLKGIDARMDAADAAYGPASDAMGAAGLDFESGRRLSTVGKAPPAAQTPTQIKVAKVRALKGGPL